MSFSVRALLPTSAKHVLVEIDLTTIQDFWANRYAYVWYLNMDQVYADIDASLLGSTVDTLNISRVGSFSQDGVQLTEGTLAQVISTEERWHWDQPAKMLYIHLVNGDDPRLHDVRIGAVTGFARTPVVHNDVLYEPRLASVPAISKRKDPLYFSRIAFSGGEIIIINTDGAYDTFAEDNDDLYGNPARVLLGFDDDAYADYRKMFSGYIERARIGRDALEISVQDKRKQLSRKVPDRTITVADFPNVKYDKIGQARPLAYGVIKEAPPIPTNEDDTTSGFYSFLLADTIHHPILSIDQVYADAGNGLVEVATRTEDLAAGTFTLEDSVWRPGNPIRVDFSGYHSGGVLIDNAVAVIEDLLGNYYGIQPTADFYDLTEWAAASAAAPDIAFFESRPTELSQIIGRISASVPGWFLVLDSGLYTFRIYNAAATVAATITAEEFMAGFPSVEYDTEQVITSVRVGYSRNWATGTHSWHTDTTREAEAYSKYKTYRQQEFETLLTTEAAATAFAFVILDYFDAVHGTLPLTLKMQLAEREVNDLLSVYVDRMAGTALGLKTVEIVGLTKDLDAMQIVAEVRIT